jgi:ribonuclease D
MSVVETIKQDLRPPLLRAGDIGESTARGLRLSGRIAWDIETSGLDWNRDQIGTCQLYSEGTGPIVVQLNGQVPSRLSGLLRDPAVAKVFHHAPFDLRFMRAQWGVQASNVRCTKIASKVVSPELETEEHSLQSVLHRMGIEISKDQRITDWIGEHLSDEQLAYAANDVRYLLPLLERLERMARERSLTELLAKCFEHIPTRVELDVRGYPDIYEY